MFLESRPMFLKSNIGRKRNRFQKSTRISRKDQVPKNNKKKQKQTHKNKKKYPIKLEG